MANQYPLFLHLFNSNICPNKRYNGMQRRFSSGRPPLCVCIRAGCEYPKIDRDTEEYYNSHKYGNTEKQQLDFRCHHNVPYSERLVVTLID